MTTLRARLATLWTNLAHVGGGQALAKPALVVLLVLDVFILVSIFDGLEEHTRQLASPSEQVPRACVELVIDRSWNETSRLDRLADAVRLERVPSAEELGRGRVHPICVPLLEAVGAVASEAE